MPPTLRADRDGRVLTIRIDNPPHNFMNREMVAELDELTDSLETDRSVGSVVVTGALDGTFITHYDVEEILTGSETMDLQVEPGLAGATLRAVGGLSRVPGGRGIIDRSPAKGIRELHTIHGLFLRWNRMDKVFLAAINGPALGGGSETALACDLRYMAAETGAIGQPEVLVGFPPGAGGTQRLTRAVGAARALEMILEATALTPEQALEVGLVHAVHPAAELEARTAEAAARLARRAPGSVAGAKRAVYEGTRRSLPEGLALERKWFVSMASQPASRRAMRAYVDELASEQSPPFTDPERMRRWQDGKAVDLVGE